MPMQTLHDAFTNELRDIYGAEKKIVKSLPKMARKAEATALQKAFEKHEKQTEQQIERLEKVFEAIDLKPRAKKCEAIDGILEEGKELMSEKAEPEVMDALLIAAAQKVEHYEITSYGTLCTWAEMLQIDQKAIKLLKDNLAEEKETDESLTELAMKSINAEALA